MLIFALLLATVSCDVAGQTCFKIGVDEKHAAPGLLATLGSRLILAGVVIYVVEFTVRFQSMTSLRLAFPFPSLPYRYAASARRSPFPRARRSPHGSLPPSSPSLWVSLCRSQTSLT